MQRVNEHGYPSKKDMAPGLLAELGRQKNEVFLRFVALLNPGKARYDVGKGALVTTKHKHTHKQPSSTKRSAPGTDGPTVTKDAIIDLESMQKAAQAHFEAAWKKVVDSFLVQTGSDAPELLLLRPNTNEGTLIQMVFTHACMLEGIVAEVREARAALDRAASADVGAPRVRRPPLVSSDRPLPDGPSRKPASDRIGYRANPETGDLEVTFRDISTTVGSLEDAAWIRRFGGTRDSVSAAAMLAEAALAFDSVLLIDMGSGSWCPEHVLKARRLTFTERASTIAALPWSTDTNASETDLWQIPLLGGAEFTARGSAEPDDQDPNLLLLEDGANDAFEAMLDGATREDDASDYEEADGDDDDPDYDPEA
jgi:hypothetical protein